MYRLVTTCLLSLQSLSDMRVAVCFLLPDTGINSGPKGSLMTL